jgi:hypothetical protein
MPLSARFGFGLMLFVAAAVSLHAQGNRPHAFMEKPLSVASENSRVAEALQRAKGNPGVVRNGLVGVEPAAFKADSVTLSLFSNVQVVAVLTNKRVHEGRGRGYPKELHTGHVAGVPDSDVVLFVRPNGTVSGRIALDGRVFTIDPADLSDKSHVVTEHDATKLAPESEPIPVGGG